MKTRKKNEHPNIVYFCIHKRLDDKVGFTRCISIKNVLRMLGEVYHIPKTLRSDVLLELNSLDMIEEVEGKMLKIAPLKSDFY